MSKWALAMFKACSLSPRASYRREMQLGSPKAIETGLTLSRHRHVLGTC